MSSATKAPTGREAAEQAVARGIAWLDANVPEWQDKIDVERLDLKYPCDCVLGQLDGDFYQAVWERRLERHEVTRMGFAAVSGVPYPVLTAAWRRALKQRVKEAK